MSAMLAPTNSMPGKTYNRALSTADDLGIVSWDTLINRALNLLADVVDMSKEGGAVVLVDKKIGRVAVVVSKRSSE
jgi:hypothetical protein